MLVNYALALASAVLLILTFPQFNVALFAPFALAPIIIAAARETRARRRLLFGYAAGMVYWAGTCYWIQFVLDFHAGMPAALSWVGFAIFAFYKALHMAAFAWLAGPLARSRWAMAAVPALWVAIERTHAPLGFAWLMLGNAGANMSLPMRLVPYAGVWGLSFVFAMLGTALALAALRRPRFQLLPAATLVLLPLLPPLPAPRRGTEIAVLVQPYISQTADWTPQWVEEQQRKLISLSANEALKAPDRRPSLIVWPEVPAPLYYAEDPRLRDQINALARTTGAHIIFNTVPRLPDNSPLNSALIVSPDGRALARYDKMNLVPFGEFVPAPFKFLVNKVSTEVGDFAPGQRQTLLPMGNHEIGAFVCYESVFPSFVRRFAAEGAELFVNISNDGWYGATAARDQHLLIARMRAAESRRWLLRATNDGITATIDPAGRLYRLMPSFIEGAATTPFSWSSETTFYGRHGDWFVWLCVLAAAAAFILTRAESQGRLRPRPRTPSPPA